MKACVLKSIGQLCYQDVPMPKVATGEVLLKIRACGICSSDIDRVFKTGTYSFPMIPGHEMAGDVVEVGEGVDRTILKRRAVVFPLRPCFHCPSCSIGEYARCDHYNYFGSRCNGGFAEYLAVPVWNLTFFPENIPYSSAALCEPAAVALNAVNTASISPGDVVSIIGNGTIGLFAAMWARIRGASQIILVGRSMKKLKYAQSLALGQIVSTQQNPVEFIQGVTAGKGADVAMEFVGNSDSISTAIMSVKKGGQVVLTGNPSGDVCMERSVYWRILRGELRLYGIWNSKYNLLKNDWNVVLKYISNGLVNPEWLISHRFPLKKSDLAFELLRTKHEDTIKVIFEME